MTIDEAVRILDPKTTAEALAAPVAGIAVWSMASVCAWIGEIIRRREER